MRALEPREPCVFVSAWSVSVELPRRRVSHCECWDACVSPCRQYRLLTGHKQRCSEAHPQQRGHRGSDQNCAITTQTIWWWRRVKRRAKTDSKAGSPSDSNVKFLPRHTSQGPVRSRWNSEDCRDITDLHTVQYRSCGVVAVLLQAHKVRSVGEAGPQDHKTLPHRQYWHWPLESPPCTCWKRHHWKYS